MYENTRIVKTLRFPGDTANQYQVNAQYLDGLSRSDIEERLEELENFDALRYMGVIANEATELPNAEKGDVYKITFKGLLGGVATVEPGDMIICNKDETPAGTIENWDIIQTNIDTEALLDHYHQGDVTFVRTDKSVGHDVEVDTEDITAQFKNGSVSITDAHSHTASGSVTVTADGTVEATSITPAGTVTIGNGNDVTVVTGVGISESANNYLTSVTVEDHVHSHTGTTDSATDTVTGTVAITESTGATNYTPNGTISASETEFVIDVAGESTTVSAHSASSANAGGFTPSGTVTLNSYTPDGSVTGSVDVTSTFASTSSTGPVMSDSVTYTAAGKDDLDSILTFSAETVVTGVSGTVTSSATPDLDFQGNAVTIGATFKGDAVAAHKHDVTVADHDAFIPNVSVDTASHSHAFTGSGTHLAATFSNGKTTGHTHSFTSSTETLEHSVSAQSEKHTHIITPTTKGIGATFIGTAASHAHTFTGNATTNAVTVTVDTNTQTLVGTVIGDVALTNASGVVKGVNITEHKISTVDSGTVVTGVGLIRQ